MEITINNLNQAIAALRQCAKENKDRTLILVIFVCLTYVMTLQHILRKNGKA